MSSLPDIFLEADGSQVEGRVVFMLTGEPEMVALANEKPWDFDMHVHNTAIVFNTTVEKILELKKTDKDEYTKKRYLGKKSVHGAQRDMHGKKLAGELLKDGFVMQPIECEKLIETYHQRYPSIRGKYFMGVRRKLMRERKLVNTWGREMSFVHDRLNDDTFREAYSFLPQSECADWMNQWGVLPLWLYCKNVLGHPPNLQCHDSLLISLQPEHAYDVARFLQTSLERPIMYPCGKELVVPVEFKLGIAWGGDEKKGEIVEFKKLPSRDDVLDVAMTLSRKRQEELAA